jgi:transcriptional regulator with XRE-family HTH domain
MWSRHIPARGRARPAQRGHLTSAMANERDPRNDLGAYLGEELRRARLAAGIDSQELLARELGFDRTVIVKAETGSSPPSKDVAPKIAARFPELCNGLYVALAEIARRSNGPIPGWFADWLEAEREAHTLRVWSPILIPGLLQTAEYARALFLAVGSDEDSAAELVGARLDRQSILDRPNPPHVIAVLDESVLHRLIGSPAIMADQLAHVASAAERLHVSVHVLPATGANAGLSGAFDLASSDDTPDTLRTESMEDQTTESRALVRKASIIFDLVRRDALPRVPSRTLILEAAEQWKSQ